MKLQVVLALAAGVAGQDLNLFRKAPELAASRAKQYAAEFPITLDAANPPTKIVLHNEPTCDTRRSFATLTQTCDTFSIKEEQYMINITSVDYKPYRKDIYSIANLGSEPKKFTITKEQKVLHKETNGWTVGFEANFGSEDQGFKLSGSKSHETEDGDEQMQSTASEETCPPGGECESEIWTWHAFVNGYCLSRDPAITCAREKPLCAGDMTLLQDGPTQAPPPESAAQRDDFSEELAAGPGGLGFVRRIRRDAAPGGVCKEKDMQARFCRRMKEAVPCTVQVPLVRRHTVVSQYVTLERHAGDDASTAPAKDPKKEEDKKNQAKKPEPENKDKKQPEPEGSAGAPKAPAKPSDAPEAPVTQADPVVKIQKPATPENSPGGPKAVAKPVKGTAGKPELQKPKTDKKANKAWRSKRGEVHRFSTSARLAERGLLVARADPGFEPVEADSVVLSISDVAAAKA